MRSRNWTIWMIWGWTNGCGLLLGVVLQAVAVHSVPATPSGGHVILDKVLLSAVVFLLCLSQQALLQCFVRAGWRDMLFQTTLTVSAFWIGFYATQVPCCHVAVSFVAGIAAGFLARHRPGEWRRWMWLSTIGFLLAAAAELCARPSGLAIVWAIGNVTALNDVGLFAGVASTAMTAWQLIGTLHAQDRPHSSFCTLQLLLA